MPELDSTSVTKSSNTKRPDMSSDVEERHQHLKDLLVERDRWINDRFAAQEKAAEKAAAAQKELAAVVSRSNEIAINKADAALHEYKAASNEFRGQLKDQAVSFIPRAETEKALAGNREMIERLREDYRELISQARDEVRMLVGGVDAKVTGLEKIYSQSKGRSELSMPLLLLVASIVGGLVTFLVQKFL